MCLMKVSIGMIIVVVGKMFVIDLDNTIIVKVEEFFIVTSMTGQEVIKELIAIKTALMLA